jgi:hypothetical protein
MSTITRSVSVAAATNAAWWDKLVRNLDSVPARFVKHMMVVADLSAGEAGAIEDALIAAWDLQRAVG